MGVYVPVMILPKAVWRTLTHAAGRIDDDARDFIPIDELPKLKWESTGLHRRVGRHRGVVRRHRLDSAGAVHRVADLLRGVAHGVLRGDAARRVARGRARPPLQLPDRVHEPRPEVPVLEHELPRRAPHLPDSALLRAAGSPRGDQGVPGPAGPVHHQRLPADLHHASPPVARPVLRRSPPRRARRGRLGAVVRRTPASPPGPATCTTAWSTSVLPRA